MKSREDWNEKGWDVFPEFQISTWRWGGIGNDSRTPPITLEEKKSLIRDNFLVIYLL